MHFDFERLFIICATIVVVSIVASITYYNKQQIAAMSKNVEFAISKGIDPLAVRCVSATSNDNICKTFVSAKTGFQISSLQRILLRILP